MRNLTRKMMLGGALLLAGAATASADVVGNFRFDGANFTDLAKNARLNIEGRFSTMEVDGSEGPAWRTDGYTSRAVGRLSNIVNGNQMSATLRFAIDTYPIIGHERAEVSNNNEQVEVAGCLNEGAKSGFAFTMGRTGKYSVQVYVGGSLVTVEGTGIVPLWNWTDLTVTVDGTKVRLYKNGVEVGSGDASSSGVKVGDSELRFALGDRHDQVGGAEICGINGAYESLTIDDAVKVPSFKGEYADLSIPASRYASDRFRARFHGQPGQNWSNETHGLIYKDGKYHAFYQKTGSAPIMSHQHWGHIVSTDLMTWKDEKPALAPSEYYDIKGCWSGCVFADPEFNNGNPTIIYTGVDFAKPYVATAYCEDPANLRDWRKDSSNPVAALTETPVGDGRDTYFYRDGNNAYFIVGAKDAVHYFKWNGSKWDYKGEFYHTEDGVDNGHNTEMPNITHMGGGKWLMTTSPLAGRYGTTCLYRVGSLSDGKFVNYSAAEKVDFFGINGYGLLSPSITTTPDGRIIALGIVPDKMPTQVNIDLGYAHLYCLPREWKLDANGKLLQTPAKEIYEKRDKTSKFTLSNETLDGYVSLQNVRGRAAEVSATFVVGEDPFGFTFYKNAKGKGGSLTYTPATGELKFDMKDLPRKIDDGNINTFSDILPIRPAKGEDFKLQMFIDHTIIDIFINDRYATSVRVYPEDDASDLIEVFAQGPTKLKSLEAYLLGNGGDTYGEPIVPPTPPKPEKLETTGKVALYVGYNTLEESFSNVEAKATYEYFKKAFPQGTILFPKDVDKINTENFDVIWINCDRRNVEQGWRNLPEEFNNEAFINALKNFNQKGGNLYLSTFATQLVVPIGRVGEEFAPNVYSSGAGEDKDDKWQTNIVHHGNDWSTHSIFYGMPMSTVDYGKLITLMSGENHREDHNCMWDLNNYGGYDSFKARTNSEVLGTWGHDGGQVGAGIIEFYPMNRTRATDPTQLAERKGTIIVNGLAACEWYPVDDKPNASQQNIEKLTTNILMYLSPVAMQEGENPTTPDDPNKNPGGDNEGDGDDDNKGDNPGDNTGDDDPNKNPGGNEGEGDGDNNGDNTGDDPNKQPGNEKIEEVLESSNKVGFYVGYNTLDELFTNVEGKATYEYFTSTFPEGTVIFPKDVATITTDNFDCVWINCDRRGVAEGWRNLPEAFSNDELISTLKAFYENGGNLYLSTFATQLLVAIDRIDSRFNPNVFGSGTGEDKDDIWATNIMHYGNDWSTHPIFSTLPVKTVQFENGPAKTLDLMSGVNHREDHNCMWDLAMYGEGDAGYEEFVNQTNSRVLGTWGHDGGINGAGLVEFLPMNGSRATDPSDIEARKGTIIANGLAACEWQPVTGVNESKKNIEDLTTNILKYLSPVAPKVEGGDNEGDDNNGDNTGDDDPNKNPGGNEGGDDNNGDNTGEDDPNKNPGNEGGDDNNGDNNGEDDPNKNPGNEGGEEGDTSGVGAVGIENTEVEWYNLQGVRVAEPKKGIYLVKKNGKFIKVIR